MYSLLTECQHFHASREQQHDQTEADNQTLLHYQDVSQQALLARYAYEKYKKRNKL